MDRASNISANVGRICAAWYGTGRPWDIDDAVSMATEIEDAVEAAHRKFCGIPPKNGAVNLGHTHNFTTGEGDETGR